MNIGILGLGSIGLRHARNLLALGHAVFGHDPDRDRCDLLMLEGGAIDRALEGGTYDGIIIATPSREHIHNMLMLAGEAKVILVEKPFGTSLVNADAVLDKASYFGTAIMCGNNLRFRGCVVRVKQWLTDGYVRNPTKAIFRVQQRSDKPAYLQDGVILNSGAHEIDLALWLLGPAKAVGATAKTVDGRDVEAVVQLRHENGCETTVILDYLADPEIRSFAIENEKGHRITANVVTGEVFYLSPDKNTSYDPGDTFSDNYREEMMAFIDLIDGRPVPHAATGTDGLATLRVILDARELAGLT